MNTKKTIPILLLFIGEILIITCFLYFGRNIETKLLTLNIIISTIVYSLYFIDILIPVVDFNDKSQKAIGSLGVRWFFTLLYTFLAFGVMVGFNIIKPVDITTQLIIHLILIFILAFGLFFAAASKQKVLEIYIEEDSNRNRVTEIKKALKDIQLKLGQTYNIPKEINTRINNLQESLRFISPSNNIEAIELENKFLIDIKNLKESLFETPYNSEKTNERIKNCEQTFNDRKQIYSN